MKILIVGEFSAFAKYLSLGFRYLGHESCIFNWGDSFKKIEQDKESLSIDISNYRIGGKDIRGSHYIKKILGHFKLRNRIKKQAQRYDCALIVNPAFVSERVSIMNPYPTMEEIQSMLKNPRMVFLSACGNDYIYNSALPYIEKAGKYNVEKFTKDLDKQKLHFEYVTNGIRGVIPVMITYADPYRNFRRLHNCKVFHTIPLPFDTTYEAAKNNHEKIWILHGITRAKEKGSQYILEALERIREKYQDKVVINVVEKKPFKEYIEILGQTDILIDQCHATSYGMNAIEALSMGKVVLSGNERGNAAEFHCDSCPVINIDPDVSQIEGELERLITETGLIDKIAKESVMYARRVHDCKIVGRQYLELFQNEINQ